MSDLNCSKAGRRIFNLNRLFSQEPFTVIYVPVVVSGPELHVGFLEFLLLEKPSVQKTKVTKVSIQKSQNHNKPPLMQHLAPDFHPSLRKYEDHILVRYIFSIFILIKRSIKMSPENYNLSLSIMDLSFCFTFAVKDLHGRPMQLPWLAQLLHISVCLVCHLSPLRL